MVKSRDPLCSLLTQTPTEDVSSLLKAWRKYEGLSQIKAADSLGISVRTLQGWELGRPMPYPRMLQTAILNSASGQSRAVNGSQLERTNGGSTKIGFDVIRGIAFVEADIVSVEDQAVDEVETK